MNWSDDYSLIGAALARRYPKVSPMLMKPDQVRDHVLGLPDFAAGTTAPDAGSLSAIGFAWIEASADDPEEAPDRF